MKEIEADGYITDEKDVSKSHACCDWAMSIRCKDCRHAVKSGGVETDIYCMMHEKHVEPEHWCSYGGK